MNPNMTLKEFLEKKQTAEIQILQWIKKVLIEFKDETGVDVQEFMIYKTQDGSIGDVKLFVDF